MNILKVFIIGLAVLLVGVGSSQGALVIDDSAQLIGTGNSQYIMMDYGDNMMERIGGVNSVVNKGVGEYHIFAWKKNVPGRINGAYGAYLDTDNDNSDNWLGYEGWCDGDIDRNTFLEGESPDAVFVAYDPDGGQFALLYAADDGIPTFDANVVLWQMEDIEYDGIIGGFSSFVFEGTDTIILKHTVLVPEPASMTILAIGGIALLRRRRRK